MEQVDGKHPCPVCGRTIFREYDSYDVCEFCGWEDNAYQEAHPYTGGGPNPSLYSYRKKYRQKIAADPDYTWAKECDEQREKKGIFWIVDRKNLQNNEPYLFCIPVDSVGVPCFLTPIPPLNSKHGGNYNHKMTWETYVPAELRRGKPYDYYPRGRVEIKEQGKNISQSGHCKGRDHRLYRRKIPFAASRGESDCRRLQALSLCGKG